MHMETNACRRQRVASGGRPHPAQSQWEEADVERALPLIGAGSVAVWLARWFIQSDPIPRGFRIGTEGQRPTGSPPAQP